MLTRAASYNNQSKCKSSYGLLSLSETNQHTTPDDRSHITPCRPTIWIPFVQVNHLSHIKHCSTESKADTTACTPRGLIKFKLAHGANDGAPLCWPGLAEDATAAVQRFFSSSSFGYVCLSVCSRDLLQLLLLLDSTVVLPMMPLLPY